MERTVKIVFQWLLKNAFMPTEICTPKIYHSWNLGSCHQLQVFLCTELLYIGSWQDENNRLKCFSVYDGGKKIIIVCSFCPVNWSYSGTVKSWKGATKQRTKKFPCINTTFFVCHLVLLSTSNFLNWSLK